MVESLLAFERLLKIMDDLREKCPWDKKQTLETLRPLTIEETYELTDAILNKDMNELKGEIGDLMMHMVFYSKIADEQNAFNIADVLNAICDKLIYRHPHIYGDTIAEDEETVKKNWEKLKLDKGRKSVLEGVPSSLPSLVKAIRIQEKASGIGFDWDNPKDVIAKIHEEVDELVAEVNNNTSDIEQELGDVLFSIVNYARFIGINPDTALEKTNKKFITRFQHMEHSIQGDNKNLKEMSLEEMDKYWVQAKKIKG
ncbi:MAG: nucleoside triphosphate pyrophosphohydrolase [Brumimicrobium sp.]|nr:nucleoside triphosphate pyrophosphohydrolase [Brumimicrobium sp.]MCO5269988.1 nucleoside triphosphate pyrophosphohydrolase [Brumimicrobium sp.]